MAKVPTLPLVSVEEYVDSSWQPDMEFVDGVLVERNVGTGLHGRLQRILLVHIDPQSARLNFEALPECRTRFQDLLEKYRDYVSLGVQHILGIDPVSRRTLDLSTEKLVARL